MMPFKQASKQASKQAVRWIASFVSVTFFFSCLTFPNIGRAQEMPWMSKPGVMVHLGPEFTPAHLKGIVIHPENALKFDFIIYKGDKTLNQEEKKQEYTKLTKYFLASLAVPDEDQWVNLSPYEKDRIIKEDFGKTEMGRDLLAQDYMLKQVTASLIYPESNLGKKFWEKIYSQAQAQYGTSNVPVNTFNKVWIVPDDALIYEKGNTAYILKHHLKVMLEEDYLSLQKHSGIQHAVMPERLSRASSSSASSGSPTKAFGDDRIMDDKTHSVSSRIVKEIVLPALEKEVNEGKSFASLRQVYSGMLLAAWYKRALKESLLSKIYANKSKVKGVDQDPKTNEEIYQQYLKAYKKGVFNFIKEDVDKYSHQTIPRKYFSGGTRGDEALITEKGFDHIRTKTLTTEDNAQLINDEPKLDMAAIGVAETSQMTKVNRNFSREKVPYAELQKLANSLEEHPIVEPGGRYRNEEYIDTNGHKRNIMEYRRPSVEVGLLFQGHGLRKPGGPGRTVLANLLGLLINGIDKSETFYTGSVTNPEGRYYESEAKAEGDYILVSKAAIEIPQAGLDIDDFEYVIVAPTAYPIIGQLQAMSDEGKFIKRFRFIKAFDKETGKGWGDILKEIAIEKGLITVSGSQIKNGDPTQSRMDAAMTAKGMEEYEAILNQLTPEQMAMYERGGARISEDRTVFGKVADTGRFLFLKPQQILNLSDNISLVDRESGRISKVSQIKNQKKFKTELIQGSNREIYSEYMILLEIGRPLGVYISYSVFSVEYVVGKDGYSYRQTTNGFGSRGAWFRQINGSEERMPDGFEVKPAFFANLSFIKRIMLGFAALGLVGVGVFMKYSNKTKVPEPNQIPTPQQLRIKNTVSVEQRTDGVIIQKQDLNLPKVIDMSKLENELRARLAKNGELSGPISFEQNGELLFIKRDQNSFWFIEHLDGRFAEALPDRIIEIFKRAEERKQDLPNGKIESSDKEGALLDATKGGIDFNAANLNLQIKRDGKGVPLPIAQQDLENININGLIPIILEIKPVIETPLLAQLQSGTEPQLAKI
ncbi:MAG: hypothetical protein HQL15_04435 [Candidatus Omnitrophica bacterium]|nr:hypothetical protein [Candidatus Omnitrophota bacterium]